MSDPSDLPTPLPPPAVADRIDAPLAEQARALMTRVLELELRDDRLDAWPSEPDDTPVELPVSWIADDGGRLLVLVAGPIADGRAELDCLIDPALAADADRGADALVAAISALAPDLVDAGAVALQLWARPSTEAHAEAALRLGAPPSRGLHQMRCSLPVAIDPIDSRAYRAHDDLEAVRSVNNRAFASHPSQGGQSAEALLATMAEPWFDPDGLRVHEREGRVAGFCWTRIHPGRPDPDHPGQTSTPLGEIFVIGVDPDFHGQGLGAPMTAAGLSWLVDQGLGTGMLYVETNNAPAVRTYEKLGFTIMRTDAAWSTPLPPAAPPSPADT